MSKYSELFRAVARSGDKDLSSAEEGEQVLTDIPSAFSLLFVDDEDRVLSAMRRIFLDENYRIFTASSAADALQVLESESIQVVVSDHRMPGMTGAQLLKEIKERWPDTIRIMLTGYADVQSVMGAVREGAVYKFITKPWNDDDLRLTVSLALQQYALMHENRKLKEVARKQQIKLKQHSGLFDQHKSALGHILTNSNMVSKEDLAWAYQEMEQGEILGETLTRLNILTEKDIIRVLQENLNIDYVDLRELHLSQGVVKCLPRDLCEKNRLVPVRLEGNRLFLAMADPSDILKCDNIAMVTGLKVTPLVASCSQILEQLAKIYNEGLVGDEESMDELNGLEPLDEIDIVIDEEERELSVDELIGSSKVPPIIRIVNAIISEAIRYRASDIHIEPKTKYTVVRFRIDGLLHSKIKVPADLHQATVSRVKILAKMDISERRRPQDGRITVKAGTRMVDMRVSSMPTINGEKMVLRILDKNAAIKNLEDLGILGEELQKINILIKRPQGVIISTGPTGSGKTTMLYSMLNSMLEKSKNYETIEDPVEYFLEEANQVYVRDKIGLSFASVLRATLRQDPDVILVGEIRDYETADVAFKASLTGHMVLSSLHTNSSIASVTRLMDMGIPPYIIASALEGILAQRLVRTICPHCKTEVPLDQELANLLKVPSDFLGDGSFMGKGCDKCNQSGYLGRTGVYEIFVMNDDFRHFISSSYKESELLQMARANGMKTLIEDGVEKVRLGKTTLSELIRVIGPQMSYERICSGCERGIDAKFLFCPFCGKVRQNMCLSCKMPLEEQWVTCPFCGTQKTLHETGG